MSTLLEGCRDNSIKDFNKILHQVCLDSLFASLRSAEPQMMARCFLCNKAQHA